MKTSPPPDPAPEDGSYRFYNRAVIDRATAIRSVRHRICRDIREEMENQNRIVRKIRCRKWIVPRNGIL
ncbi:hypothetical protein [uncultured Methanoregula sp.]|uniref:hypothetical protein n=1 Tax=uncultured Methanoregula sp. TaxID=1005933 RepID=UPI002AABAAD2|nr:hypothetical protein [uncultured Methanoregula sp.]